MPEIPNHLVGATQPRPDLPAKLLGIQIRRGLTLLRRLEAREETVAYDHTAWHECNQRLLRLLIASYEVWQTYLRTVSSRISPPAPMPPPVQAEDVRSEVRELESVASKLGLSETDLAASVPAVSGRELPADDRVLIVHGRNEEAKEKVARFLMKL